MTESFKSDSPDEQRLVDNIRQRMDQSVNALDGQTLSRLNRIRHAALEHRQARASRMLLPFGGFVTACVLVVSVMMFTPGTPDTEAVPSAMEDLDILTSSDSLDLYEDYEFYQWLAENDAQV
jgi:hypothetical protein